MSTSTTTERIKRRVTSKSDVLTEIGNSSKLGPEKKQRANSFAHGAITRIKVTNFLTYREVEFFPGPNLNLIVGPNGTGKSTLVCAICLGLAGKPAVLGRAGQIADYIQYGYEKAQIEIELFNTDGDNWIVFREINKNGTSSWTVNNRMATLKAVEETIRRLNIQVGNLCQFLPQDRVADFVKMSSVELLENTQKAVGMPELLEKQCALIKLRGQARELESSSKTNSELLDKEKERNLQLEQEVKNYNERQKYLERIEQLKRKRKWVEYDIVRESYNDKKKNREGVIKERSKLVKSSDPLRQKVREAAQVAPKHKKKIDELGVDIRDVKQKMDLKTKQIEDFSDKVAQINQRLNEKLQDEEQRKNRVKALQQQVKVLEEELNSIQNEQIEDMQAKLNEVNSEIVAVNKELTELQSSKENLKLSRIALERELQANDQELKRVSNVAAKRLDLLRQLSPHTYDAVLWLRENRDKFAKTIHDPIMMTINVHDQQFVKFVEAHISRDNMIAFACEDAQDLDKFMTVVRDQRNLRVNAVLVPDKPLESYCSKRSIDSIKQFGFTHYIRDLFSAPEGVTKYLCELSNIHNIPVGNRYTEDNIEKILHQSGFDRIYTPNRMYVMRKSRYASGVHSTVSTEIRQPRVLTLTIDNKRMKQLQTRQTEVSKEIEALQEGYVALDEREGALLLQQEHLRRKKKELVARRDLRKSLLARIKQREEQLEIAGRSRVDVEAEENRAANAISKINKDRLTVLKKLASNNKALLVASQSALILAFEHAKALDKHMQIEGEFRSVSEEIQQLEARIEEMTEDLKKTKEEGRRLLLDAKRASGLREGDLLPERELAAFNCLPDTIEEIDSKIHEEQAKADCMLQTDENVIQDYKKRTEAIKRMSNQMEENERKLKLLQEEVEKIKDDWLPSVENLVEKVNQNFSQYFASLGCAGEVSLGKGDNPDDFEKYGICIRVKYRDGDQLCELTQHHQSGGERSVATVLYLLSLQELTSVPFRCVDEINQGMDSINERKIFDLIVKTACSKNTSQYFLLTPKLLPGLEYSRNMTVVVIHNGTIHDPQKWDVKKFIQRQRRLL